MTSLTPSDPRPDRHLDDEQLSARIDGERDPLAESHLSSCGRCRGRLDDLAAAGSAIASTTDVRADEVRDASVAAALAVWDAEIATEEVGTDELAARRAQHRAVPRWLVAAAVLVVIGLAALPFVRLGDDEPTFLAEAGDSTADRDSAFATGEASDLGAIDDVSVLDERLREVLGVPPREEAAGAADASGGPSALETFGDTATRSQLTAGGSEEQSSKTATAKPLTECRSAAVAFAGDEHTTNAYSASLVFRSIPAYVFVFVKGMGDNLSRRAVVVDRSGCALLVAQSF